MVPLLPTRGPVPLHVGHGAVSPAYATLALGLAVLVASLHLDRTRWADRPARADAGVFLGAGLVVLSLVAVRGV